MSKETDILKKIEKLNEGWGGYYEALMREIILEQTLKLNTQETLPIKEWIEKNIYLPSELMGSGRASFWSFAGAKYLLKVCEFLEPENPVEEIFINKCAQSYVTTFATAYMIQEACQRPSPAMYFNSSDDTVKAMISQKMDPMIDSCSLARLVYNSKRSTEGKNSDKEKSGIGFTQFFRTAGSVNSFSGISAKIVIADELARYPQTSEGDSYDLIVRRLQTFKGSGKKILSFTTPTKSDGYVIQKSINATKYRRKTSCPKCGKYEELLFEGLVYLCPKTGEYKRVIDTDLRGVESALIDEVLYNFSCCGHKMNDEERIIRNNNEECTKWVEIEKGEKTKVSMDITYMMTSTIGAMDEIAKTYIQSWEYDRISNSYRINYNIRQALWNQMLALPYDESISSSSVKPQDYYKYRSSYKKGMVLPQGTFCVTVGIDTQAGTKDTNANKSIDKKARIELIYLAHVLETDGHLEITRENRIVIDRRIIHESGKFKRGLIIEEPSTYSEELLEALNARFYVYPDCPISNPSFWDNIETEEDYHKKKNEIDKLYVLDENENYYAPRTEYLSNKNIATMGVSQAFCDLQGKNEKDGLGQTSGIFRFYAENHPARERIAPNGRRQENTILERFVFIRGDTRNKNKTSDTVLFKQMSNPINLQNIAKMAVSALDISLNQKAHIEGYIMQNMCNVYVQRAKEILLNPVDGLVFQTPCSFQFAQHLTDNDIQGFFSEERVSILSKKGIENYYEYKNISGIRNEVLDCSVYAYVAYLYFTGKGQDKKDFKNMTIKMETAREKAVKVLNIKPKKASDIKSI